MTTGLAELAARPRDTIVCFDRHGKVRTQRELAAAAAGVEAALLERDGERWALNFSDVFDFTAALLGCWAAGRTAVLAPVTLLDTAGLVAIDGVIEPATAAAAAPQRIVFDGLSSNARRLAPIQASAAIVLYTSGSTGVPKEVGRQLTNMEHELAAFEATWGADLGACRVYSTVSHRHVYGLLFRVLWPLSAQRPFASFDLEYPEQLLGPVSDGQILVSSPALFKRIGHLGAGEARWRAVFSSGGTLPDGAGADATRVLGVAPIEVLGSTETSGVGWRRVAEPRFAAFPSVELRVSPDELLEVRSPFSGSGDWLRMGDRVRLHHDGGIELLGRADRIAKIEDKRISLTEIEAHLIAHPLVKDSAAVALDRGGRQQVGAVIELSERGRAALAARGRAALGRELRAALRGKIDAVGVPRLFRYRDGIPVDAQGKRQAAALAALFAAPQ
jgi:acyl-coenzyme A synthetase/AMP-(fatty) acid ligase